ncbi:potassium voltage-gated channel subfamily E regulatory beta subunit 5-like [Heptranchias perlo]|uniref:potassium voltage-gated channel subfamily E regulatory beta subunit 5-like n=1 Tax=Heptranchias perlo TaxID=212740 RepID=UPI00355A5111
MDWTMNRSVIYSTAQLYNFFYGIQAVTSNESLALGPRADADYGDAYVFILAVMVFFAFLAGTMLLGYTSSSVEEPPDDPSHLCGQKSGRPSGGRTRANPTTRPV